MFNTKLTETRNIFNPSLEDCIIHMCLIDINQDDIKKKLFPGRGFLFGLQFFQFGLQFFPFIRKVLKLIIDYEINNKWQDYR
jgi:hypothetical protein